MDGEDGYDEQGTTNREVVAKHLDMSTFVHVLSSRFYDSVLCLARSGRLRHRVLLLSGDT